jgi:elongation factor Ts
MEITSETIKKLRDRTGAGMMDCKRALEASAGDMEKAIEYLRKKGAAVGQKRADRAAKEGAIATRVSADGKRGVIVEVNSETDFVGRSEDFVNFGHLIAEAIEKHKPGSLDQIQTLSVRGKTVAEHLNDLLAKVGEKVEIRRYVILETPDGRISSYTHLGNKIGVLVEIAGAAQSGSSDTVGRDIAMQVAAMNPMVISRDRIEPSVVEAELEVYRSQAKNEGKPDKIVDRIAQGKLDKFYQEVVLMEQTFIKDGGKTVKDYLQDAAGPGGGPLVVRNFTRYHLGEEIR